MQVNEDPKYNLYDNNISFFKILRGLLCHPRLAVSRDMMYPIQAVELPIEQGFAALRP